MLSRRKTHTGFHNKTVAIALQYADSPETELLVFRPHGHQGIDADLRVMEATVLLRFASCIFALLSVQFANFLSSLRSLVLRRGQDQENAGLVPVSSAHLQHPAPAAAEHDELQELHYRRRRNTLQEAGDELLSVRQIRSESLLVVQKWLSNFPAKQLPAQ